MSLFAVGALAGVGWRSRGKAGRRSAWRRLRAHAWPSRASAVSRPASLPLGKAVASGPSGRHDAPPL